MCVFTGACSLVRVYVRACVFASVCVFSKVCVCVCVCVCFRRCVNRQTTKRERHEFVPMVRSFVARTHSHIWYRLPTMLLSWDAVIGKARS